MRKERKVSDCKSRRLAPEILEMLDGTMSYKQVANKIGVSVPTIKKVALNNGVDLVELKKKIRENRVDGRSARAKTKRNEMIKTLLDAGWTYVDIAREMGITKQRVYQVAKVYGVKRWEVTREFHQKIVADIEKDVSEGMSYNDVKVKYNLDTKMLQKLRHHGLGNLFSRLTQERREGILEEYKTKLAREVVSSHDSKLDNPNKLTNIGQVYKASTKLGFRKYPKIGNRNAGGLFESKEVIMIIKVKREVEELSFAKIAAFLNEKGYKTPMGRDYQDHNVRFKYMSIKKNNL